VAYLFLVRSYDHVAISVSVKDHMSNIFFLFSVSLFSFAIAAFSEQPLVKFSSPDGRFALRISATEDESEMQADLIERESGKSLVDLGTAQRNLLSQTVLLWSADSKWAAYATRNNRFGETTVYFWSGTSFEKIELPVSTDFPWFAPWDFSHPCDREKMYEDVVQPQKWVNPGLLQLSWKAEETCDELTGTAEVLFTMSFDSHHRASIQKVIRKRSAVH
jgi:hypothetical protein